MADRIEYMDWLRALSIIAVVGVHVVSKLVNTDTPGDWAWHYANAIDSGLRWCVPVFFMLSGALLLTRKPGEPVFSFLQKRLFKVLVPLLIWSGIYLFYRQAERDDELTFWGMIRLFLSDDVYYHLWFMYLIVGLYLMTPFLRLLVHHMHQKMFMIFLLFWFVYSGLLPFLPKFWDVELALTAGLFDPYIGYYLLGAYLYKYPISRKAMPALTVLAAAGYFITLWGTAYLTEKQGALDEFFYEHYRPNSLFVTLFLYGLFQQLGPRLKSSRIIRQISLATLGIYLIHPLVQYYLAQAGINETVIHPAVGVPIAWSLIFGISFLIVWLVRKIPVLHYLFP